jgi:site-specific DNA-methyltransferase (adenine-specific)
VTPYYSDDLVTIYHGDAREMPLVGDVLVSDPPYGLGMGSFTDDFEIASAVLAAVPADRAAIFMSPRRLPALVRVLEGGGWRFGRVLWMHKTADIAAPWRGWCMNSESIVVADRPDVNWPKPESYRSDVYTVGPWERDGHHPAAKPVAVVTDLISRLSRPTETTLDPFMGSGTTLVAAKALGRHAIGIEIEERYCEIAATRCSQEVLGLSA